MAKKWRRLPAKAHQQLSDERLIMSVVGRLVPVTTQPVPKRGSSSPPHQRCSACYQTWLFVYKKKIIQAFLGVFEKKSGANVLKLYSTARGCSEVATRRSVYYDKFWVHRFKIKN
jgi:hypothetical protein